MAMCKMKSNQKPPLARTPVSLRPRSSLRSDLNTAQTPSGSLRKTRTPNRSGRNTEESSGLRPEYRSISCELKALAEMVCDEFGTCDSPKSLAPNSSPLFERGRFYEEYSARRNERLRKRKSETGSAYDLGVMVESAKRRGMSSKKLGQNLRASMPGTFSVDPGEVRVPRYSLRSSSNKENKKPPLAPMNSGECSDARGGRRVTRARRSRNV